MCQTCAPTAQPIPAWGNAPGSARENERGLKARPMRDASIPHISFVVFDAVFFEEHPELFLKRPPPVMLLLPVNVFAQGIQIRWPDGKTPIAALPCERTQRGRLCLEPFRRRRFQLLDQVGDRERARKANREMHVVSAADAIRLASRIARDGREVRVKRAPRLGVADRAAIFCAEDDVDDDKASPTFSTRPRK